MDGGRIEPHYSKIQIGGVTMSIKKGDGLICVNNPFGYRLTVNDLYVAIHDEVEQTIRVTNDVGDEFTYPTSLFKIFARPLDEGSFPITLSTLETCIELLDAIRKPNVSYNRDQKVMMQNVIDNNVTNAELVRLHLKWLLPKSESLEK